MKISNFFSALALGAVLGLPAVAYGQAESSNNTATERNDDGSSNLGWLGLVGLAGLIGLKKKAGDTNRAYGGNPATART